MLGATAGSGGAVSGVIPLDNRMLENRRWVGRRFDAPGQKA